MAEIEAASESTASSSEEFASCVSESQQSATSLHSLASKFRVDD